MMREGRRDGKVLSSDREGRSNGKEVSESTTKLKRWSRRSKIVNEYGLPTVVSNIMFAFKIYKI